MSQLNFFRGLLVKCVTLLDVNWEPVFCICIPYHSLFFHWIEPFQVSSPQRPNFPWGRTSQQQPLCVLFRCFLCYSGRLKFHFFRFMGSCWIPIFSKKLCFVFRLAYPKHLPEVKTCLAHGSQEVPEEDLDTTLPQPGHGFRGSVKTWRGWMRNVRNREHAGKAIAYHLYFNIFHNMIYIYNI